jgi:CheY-like chemotaxis protein
MAAVYLFAVGSRYSLNDSEQESGDMVLVVDDEYQSVIPLLKLLEQAKVPFRYVAGGIDAISELRRSPFRLVFMDLAMPNLTGVETLVKADQLIENASSPTPVVIYSGTEIEAKPSHPFRHLSVVDTWNKSMNLFRLHTRLNNVLSSIGS